MAAKVTRRQGREWALQMLCQADMNTTDDLVGMINDFWVQQYELLQEDEKIDVIFVEEGRNEAAVAAEKVAPVAIRQFAEERVIGVRENLQKIDIVLKRHMKNWDLYRLGTVERNVLRLGLWELLVKSNDIPGRVAINEAIDLAKYYSDAKSGRFVNGILDSALKNINKPKAKIKPTVPEAPKKAKKVKKDKTKVKNDNKPPKGGPKSSRKPTGRKPDKPSTAKPRIKPQLGKGRKNGGKVGKKNGKKTIRISNSKIKKAKPRTSVRKKVRSDNSR